MVRGLLNRCGTSKNRAAPSHVCDICALLGVLEEFTGFLVLCLVGRIVRRGAEIVPVPV